MVREGRPHLVTVIGQAGVGKSRLLRELESALAARPAAPTVRQGRCLPYGSGIVFWALGEVLRAECGIVDRDSADVAWHKLRRARRGAAAAAATDDERRAQAALIGRLLGHRGAARAAPARRARIPQRMRESFFSAVRSAIEAMARRSPLVLVFEDIHWADHGMLDLIEHLGAVGARRR